MQQLLEARAQEFPKRQVRKLAKRICRKIEKKRKRNRKAAMFHRTTRLAKLEKKGYDLSEYKGGTMLIRRL